MEKKFAFTGALLFTVGLFTGLWSAIALTGQIAVKMPRLALASHLNGLVGGLWLIGISHTLPFLSYKEKQQKRLFYLSVTPTWANWAITLLASFLGVQGLTYTHDSSNNAIAFLLQLLVVLPSLIAGVYWIRGFKKETRST